MQVGAEPHHSTTLCDFAIVFNEKKFTWGRVFINKVDKLQNKKSGGAGGPILKVQTCCSNKRWPCEAPIPQIVKLSCYAANRQSGWL